jgi:hypothetical protein
MGMNELIFRQNILVVLYYASYGEAKQYPDNPGVILVQ